MNITYVKRLLGVPAEQNIVKKIVDEKIISKVYAIRIANYILNAQGLKWWRVQGTFAATEMLYQFDDIAFWIDGTRYDGFLEDDPDLDYSFRQGEASLVFQVSGLFLKSEE